MGPQAASRPATLSERADELEERMMQELKERVATKSVLFTLADGKLEMESGAAVLARNPGKYFLMGADPRLPQMPDKPTLIDFFRCRFASTNHLLQSATHALKAGLDEKLVLACLLHDIGVVSFIRCDHGYWGAQLIEPYVEEEVSWAVRAHQSLRFYPDESVGYKYPEMYVKLFGPDYRPEPYIEEEYKRARAHKWYMISRLITVNDIYSFDPDAKVELDDFTDVIAHVAHADVADPVFVITGASFRLEAPACVGIPADYWLRRSSLRFGHGLRSSCRESRSVGPPAQSLPKADRNDQRHVRQTREPPSVHGTARRPRDFHAGVQIFPRHRSARRE